MTATPLSIPDLLLIKPKVFEDERGYFFESFNQEAFEMATGLTTVFVQDNESLSRKGVLRGLHFQAPPHAQAKLVRVVHGAVYDVAVDLRKGSPTYGQWDGALLTAANKHQLYVPEGFAHGFAVMDHDTIFAYKCSGYYHKASEVCIAWNDPAIDINWPVEVPIISQKDREDALAFQTFESPF